MPQNSIKAFPLVTVDSSTLDATLAAITDVYTYPIVRLHIVNDSDVTFFFKFEGDDIQDVVLSKGEITIVPQLSAVPNNKEARFKAQTILYGAVSTKGTGDIYIAAYYV